MTKLNLSKYGSREYGPLTFEWIPRLCSKSCTWLRPKEFVESRQISVLATVPSPSAYPLHQAALGLQSPAITAFGTCHDRHPSLLWLNKSDTTVLGLIRTRPFLSKRALSMPYTLSSKSRNLC